MIWKYYHYNNLGKSIHGLWLTVIFGLIHLGKAAILIIIINLQTVYD